MIATKGRRGNPPYLEFPDVDKDDKTSSAPEPAEAPNHPGIGRTASTTSVSSFMTARILIPREKILQSASSAHSRLAISAALRLRPWSLFPWRRHRRIALHAAEFGPDGLTLSSFWPDMLHHVETLKKRRRSRIRGNRRIRTRKRHAP